ncbi:MAG: hypothetical protein LBB65_03740 [Burkholderiales bacterium]|jgi:hypothetical protein|nr:hypothetical protein [Burkholderiales bacterium]
MFTLDLYIKIDENTITVRNAKTGQEVSCTANPGFSSSRLLVADFTIASKTIKNLLKEISSPFLAQKRILMHSLKIMEGGWSQVELRIFQELAIDAGAQKEAICIEDRALSGQEVLDFWKS